MSVKNSVELYSSGEYQTHNADWHAADSPWKAAHILEMLSRNPLPLEDVADVGCGVGEVISVMARSRPEVQFSGFDVAPQTVERARQKKAGNTSFSSANPFEDSKTYDLAMAIDVFEHVEDYFGFLRNMRKISKYQIYHIPLELSVSTILRRTALMNARSNLGHIQHFTKETAMATLTDTGHTIVDWKYTNGSVELTAKRTFKKKIAAVPRRLGRWLSPDLAARTLGGVSLLVLCK